MTIHTYIHTASSNADSWKSFHTSTAVHFFTYIRPRASRRILHGWKKSSRRPACSNLEARTTCPTHSTPQRHQGVLMSAPARSRRASKASPTIRAASAPALMLTRKALVQGSSSRRARSHPARPSRAARAAPVSIDELRRARPRTQTHTHGIKQEIPITAKGGGGTTIFACGKRDIC